MLLPIFFFCEVEKVSVDVMSIVMCIVLCIYNSACFCPNFMSCLRSNCVSTNKGHYWNKDITDMVEVSDRCFSCYLPSQGFSKGLDICILKDKPASASIKAKYIFSCVPLLCILKLSFFIVGEMLEASRVRHCSPHNNKMFCWFSSCHQE